MNPQDPYQKLQNPQTQGSSLPPVPQENPSFPQPSSSTNPYAQTYDAPSAQPAENTSQFEPQPQIQPLTPLNGASDSASVPDDYTTVDYLNRIAPQEQKTINRFAVFGLIGSVLVSVILVFVMMMSSQGPSVNELIPPISKRIDTLATVAKAETTKLTQNEIVEANASLSSSLNSMKAQLDAIIKERKIKATGSSSTEKAYLENLQKKLDDSYQKGTLDRTYTTQMTFELSSLKSQINKLKRTSKNKSITEFCDSAITNIDTILAAYGKFEGSKS